MLNKEELIKNHITNIRTFSENVHRGEIEWEDFHLMIEFLLSDKDSYGFTQEDLKKIKHAFGELLDIEKLQDKIINKPYNFSNLLSHYLQLIQME